MFERINSIDDPRVACYRHLRDRTARGENLFIAEGRLLVERLLASRYEVQSVLATATHQEHLQQQLPPDVPHFEGDAALLRQIVGFPFHRGVLAAGVRGAPFPFETLTRSLASQPEATIVACPEIKTPDNLGLVFRSVAALGADAVLLGARSCDPLSRRCLRLSMGACLDVPFVTPDDFDRAVATLRREQGFETVATVLDDEARPLDNFAWPARRILLVGNEFYGLARETLDTADHRVTIPMSRGTDSLNVAVAAGIFLYEAMRSVRSR